MSVDFGAGLDTVFLYLTKDRVRPFAAIVLGGLTSFRLQQKTGKERTHSGKLENVSTLLAELYRIDSEISRYMLGHTRNPSLWEGLYGFPLTIEFSLDRINASASAARAFGTAYLNGHMLEVWNVRVDEWRENRLRYECETSKKQ